MNAPDHLPASALDPAEQGRIATLNRFKLEEFQHMTKEDLLLAQSIAGHGNEWGVWKTPKSISPGKISPTFRDIDLAKRLRDYLAQETELEASLELLVGDGVLLLTRIALLLRLAPTGGQRRTKNRRLKPSTLAQGLFSYGPQILARAIRRKAKRPDAQGLIACLTEEDVRELGKVKKLRIELERFGILAARGWWNDLPPQPDITRTTNPRGSKQERAPEESEGEYQPIPDTYLAEIGPRILWLIRDLGPNLLPLLEDFATCLESLDWAEMTRNKLRDDNGIINKFIARHLREHPWKDLAGKLLKPNFPLKTGSKNKNKFEWPPRNYEQLKVLSVTLQSAHLFLTLFACAGRIGEIETLPRSCVTTESDGKGYVRGWTYKLSSNLFGDARQWPAPTVLVQVLGQQIRLAAVWSRLPPGKILDGLPKGSPAPQALWLSLGAGGGASAAAPLGHSVDALKSLAERVGMDPKPGGINLHPHRFRKTIGRVAGIALFNSPLVLKRLFGHKSIEMTLRYILCDQDIRTEAEAVLRELRILHCAEAIEEVREALAKDAPLPGHSGAPAERMFEAVKEHEARLAKAGRLWAEGSAYELAYLMTANGQGWRFIQKNIVCTKVPGEDGLCKKKRNRGEPDTSNCKIECSNRIVLAIERRVAGEVVESYLDVARQALGDEQYMVFYEAMQRVVEELDSFPDIKAQYLTNPEVKSLFITYQEVTQ
jgi:hypothetical protein